MPAKDKDKSYLPRILLCQLLTRDPKAGKALDCIVGWSKHATLPRKGKRGRWNAFSLADFCRESGLTPKQLRRVRPLLEGYARIEVGGYAGKKCIWTQPTALTNRFTAGKYATKAEARKALEALMEGTVAQVPVLPTQAVAAAPTQVCPTGGTAGHDQGHNEGQDPILSLHPFHSLTEDKNQTLSGKGKGMEGPGTNPENPGNPESKVENQIKENSEVEVSPPNSPPAASEDDDDDAKFEEAMKQLQLKKAKQDAKLYPEVPIPKGCPVVHPKDYFPNWVSFSKGLKDKIYAKFKEDLYNWKNGKAGKHAASVYGFGTGDSGTKTMKYVLSEEDQALIDAETASGDEDEDEVA